YGLLLVCLLIAPGWASSYWIAQLGFVLIYAIAGLGLMVLSGYTGLLSIGHAAFLGVGAYAQAWLTSHGVPFVPALLAAGALSALAGVV
ncbi:branched-chain amino acid ABC transporter permease, partial [Variovorax sp. 2RAF20]